MQAFEKVGGAEYLVKLAEDDPKTFVPLLAKMIPTDVRVDGNAGLHVTINRRPHPPV
jgi:hypothetical protein